MINVELKIEVTDYVHNNVTTKIIPCLRLSIPEACNPKLNSDGKPHCHNGPFVIIGGDMWWALDGLLFDDCEDFIKRSGMTEDEKVVFKLKYNSFDFKKY